MEAQTVYRPRELNHREDQLPPRVEAKLMEKFIGVFCGMRGWVGMTEAGQIFTIRVTQTGPDSYLTDYDLTEKVIQAEAA